MARCLRLRAHVQWKTTVVDANEVALCAATDELVVGNGFHNKFRLLRPSDGAIVCTKPVHTEERGTVLASSAQALYLSVNWSLNEVYIVGIADGALQRTISVQAETLSSETVLALDAARNLLYVGTCGAQTTLSVYRTTDGARLHSTTLPLKRLQCLNLVVTPATGHVFAVALPHYWTGDGPWFAEVLLYNTDATFVRRVAKVNAGRRRFTAHANPCTALDANGDLLYVASVSLPFDGRIDVVRVSDGRRLGVIVKLVGKIDSLCATPTALVVSHFCYDMVVSLQLPARLRWQPDASVHPLFDDGDDGGEEATGNDGRRFCRGVAAALAAATCRSGSAAPQLQRLPLELLCLVFAQMAPVVLDRE